MTIPTGATQARVAGRLVVLRHGTKTQTVNICTEKNQVGEYEDRWVLDPMPWVTVEDVQELTDLDVLRHWLIQRGGAPGPTHPGQTTALPALISAAVVDDKWLQQARAAVERALTTLVHEFCESPYLHRVEHSLHTRLYQLLKQEPLLGGEVPLTSGDQTQLVHKEWPETYPRTNADGTLRPRGLFDLAVIAPEQVRQANRDQFLTGRLEAPIVIEVGLDYGARHLEDDADKLANSKVRAGYLLHLSRLPAYRVSADVQALVSAQRDHVRTAYVHHNSRLI